MEALMTAIVLWLSANFDLPGIQEHPRIEFASEARIVAQRYRGLAGGQLAGSEPAGSEQRIVAVYDDAAKTILLREGWTGATPAELSVLVHEMVHHLQNVGKLKFACPQEREQVAYRAQERWLRLFGRDLQRDFQIDAFSLLVKTKCMY